MATSATAGFSARVSSAAGTVPLRRKCRRSISPQAGRALELLGHAIEYLADEFIHEQGEFTSRNPQIKAMQILMALNRQVYFECPEVPSLTERFRSLLRRRAA